MRVPLREILAAAGVALLIPAAAVAKPDSDKPDKGRDKAPKSEKAPKADKAPSSGESSEAVEAVKAPKAPKTLKGKNVSRYNIDGTVSSIGSAAASSDPAATPDASGDDDVVVAVTRGNSRGVRFAGQSITFDLSRAVIKVADTNGDGARNLQDVKEGDTVKVKLRLARDGSSTQPYSADRFEVKVAEPEEEEPEVVTP
jgi:hypothetical protein